MWLMKKSTKVTFVNSNMQDDRVSLPKNRQALQDMDEDEGNIYMTSIHDRYASCPESLENMCLAKFAVTYEPKYESSGAENDELNINENPNDDENEDDLNENYINQFIKLKNNLGFMRKRKKESILHVTSFKQHKEPEKYYHAHLILYLPWHNEDQLLGGGTTYHNDQMDTAINDIADNGPPQIAWDSIAPTIEQNNNNSSENDIITIHNIDSDEDDDNTPPDLDDNPLGQHGINDSRKNKMSRLFEREAHKDIMCNSNY